jgi:UDP-N-acetylmuramate: L-alanyl-gamma-D-glutamyl-meso-diaminopimelate ligase
MIENLKEGAHIHMMGICGTAMASLAGMLKNLGFKVTGSDQNVYPPMSDLLRGLGIPIKEGYQRENLEPRPDLVIVGNVMTRKHEESQALLESDIPFTNLPKVIGELLIGDRKSVVVAGTHGKTTTTAMLSWLAETCNLRPGFLVGGIPLNFQSSFRNPEADLFIIEGDEYDSSFFDKVPKFNHYRPKFVILTSVEFDHIDIYDSMEDVEAAFKGLMERIPEDGVLIYNGEDPRIQKLVGYTRCKRVLSYGLENGDYSLESFKVGEGGYKAQVTKFGEVIAEVSLPVFGKYNVANAIASLALSLEMGWDRELVLKGLSSFKGVKRRQEVIGKPNGITVIEDFAHHPTAVKLTIEGVQERFPGKKVISVFEPRSATSRRRVFQREYLNAFLEAQVLLLSEIFNPEALDEDERLSPKEIVEHLKERGNEAYYCGSYQEIINLLSQKAEPGGAVLLMSNGAFGGIYSELLEALK